MPRHVVATTSEIAPCSHKVVTVGGREIVVFHVNGQSFALLNLCPHAGAPLARAATWPISRRRSRPLSAHAHRRNAPLRLAWLGIRHAYGSNPMATPTPAGALLSRRGPPGPGQETLGRRNLCRHGRGELPSRGGLGAQPAPPSRHGPAQARPLHVPAAGSRELRIARRDRRREIEGDSPRVNASSRYPALPPGNFGRTPDARAAL
jgi:Rieske [2Fe-2S] domain